MSAAASSSSMPSPSPAPQEAPDVKPAPAQQTAIIKHVDLSDEMQQEAVDVASQAMEKYNIEKDIAMHIKKEFDRRFGTTWHCVVGKNFGSFVTHETRHFIYFYLGQIAILLWKSS